MPWGSWGSSRAVGISCEVGSSTSCDGAIRTNIEQVAGLDATTSTSERLLPLHRNSRRVHRPIGFVEDLFRQLSGNIRRTEKVVPGLFRRYDERRLSGQFLGSFALHSDDSDQFLHRFGT